LKCDIQNTLKTIATEEKVSFVGVLSSLYSNRSNLCDSHENFGVELSDSFTVVSCTTLCVKKNILPTFTQSELLLIAKFNQKWLKQSLAEGNLRTLFIFM